MSTAATQQQPPAIPPRPSKGQERDQLLQPKIPPRPAKRGVSPNPDRYAPSPLNSGFLGAKKDRSNSDDPIDRAKSVELPAVAGEEGVEYDALAGAVESSQGQGTSPAQTRTVDENLRIYAPTAERPASSAKDRIMQVTRTDSERAASFGIGKAVTEVPTPSNRSLRRKASTGSALSQDEADDGEEHGIPEIGQQIPLLPNAGDVQAPSPAPGSEAAKTGHKRKSSSRGLPPGSYGLHGHGVAPQDKLDKEYYQKHPELLKKEHHPYQHDRPTNFSMSSDQLNRLVRETEMNGHGVGTYDHTGTPSEQIGWAALEATSRPQSTKPGDHEIMIEEPNRPRSVLLSTDPMPEPLPEEGADDYTAPILAEDEVRKSTPHPDQVPCIDPSREHRGSELEAEPPRSRPTSRPTSLYRAESSDLRSTPLEDVEEYEPLFPEDEGGVSKEHLTPAQIEKIKQRFPSKDIWEDAPSSVHHTATVSTPEPSEDASKKDAPSRQLAETPARLWARKHEELAEKELTHPDAFLWRNQKPTWVGHQPHLAQEVAVRPKMAQKFPSRDIWEDTPDSLKLETTVSGPQVEAPSPVDNKPPEVSGRPQRKPNESQEAPSIPERPKAKSPDETSKPVIPDRPKPQIPARPVKASPPPTAASADAPARKPKPAVPARPAGNRIAALQAGFMSDLNKKLGLGPKPPKPEPKEEAAEEPQEKAPLSDARKGRARGPQRRAPAAKAPATTTPAAATTLASSEPAAEKPKLTFATTVTVWSVDPETEGDVVVEEESPAEPVKEPTALVAKAPAEAEEKPSAPVVEAAPEDKPVTEAAKAVEEAAPEAQVGEEKKEKEVEREKEDEVEQEPVVETKETLATNTAGEPVAKAIVEEDKAESKVEAKDAALNPVED